MAIDFSKLSDQIVDRALRDPLSAKALHNSLGGRVKPAQLGGNHGVAGDPMDRPSPPAKSPAEQGLGTGSPKRYDLNTPEGCYEAWRDGSIDTQTYRRALDDLAKQAEAEADESDELDEADEADADDDSDEDDEDDPEPGGSSSAPPGPAVPATKRKRAARAADDIKRAASALDDRNVHRLEMEDVNAFQALGRTMRVKALLAAGFS
ncbi:MAG: hypothetical protein JOZ69_16610 [Myxococcales bacterium]|nr:hypothetical protein [Myxococcales bacterium]